MLKLGASDLVVSELCLGAMFLGTRTDRTASLQVLDGYVEAGGNFVDSANIYAHWVPGFKGGESETLIGEWLRSRGRRSDIVIATKVGFDYPGVERGLPARRILEECDKSLKRLGVDTIDLYYAHVDDYTTPLEETLEAFNRLVAAGKVRYIGASNYLAWRLERARCTSLTNHWAPFCCVQQRHTYLRIKPGGVTAPQVASNPDLIDYSRRTGLPILAYSILLGGAYTNPARAIGPEYSGPDTDARLAMLRTVAAECGATVPQIIIAWMRQSDYPVLPLIAASRTDQLHELVGALAVNLSDDQMQRLDSAGG
ncbi:MAG TPA: aldo/keto reductase [Aggregatilineales bacterium]|nr:aldo/keto reductase [Aggregatilineales bacterium]